MNKVLAILATVALLGAPASVSAQDIKHHHGKHSTPEVFGAVQMDYGYQQDVENALSLGAVRLGVKGSMAGFGYRVEYDVQDETATEMLVTFRAPADIDLAAGLMRAPFGVEASAHDTKLPFIARSQASEAFAIDNTIGLRASTNVAKLVDVTAALLQDDAEVETYIGRASIRANDMIRFGGAVASRDGDTRWGADATVEYGAFALTGEYLVDAETETDGYYATLGYTLSPRTLLQARFDAVDGSDEQIVLGYTLAASQNARLQVNYGMPANDLGETELHRLTARLQVRF